MNLGRIEVNYFAWIRWIWEVMATIAKVHKVSRFSRYITEGNYHVDRFGISN